MAVKWFTGFEAGANAEAFSAVTTAGSSTVALATGAAARSGTYGCTITIVANADDKAYGHLNSTNNANANISGGFGTDTRLHAWFKISAVPFTMGAMVEEMLLHFVRPATYWGGTLTLDSDGKIACYMVKADAADTELMGRTASAYNDGEWHSLQFRETRGAPSTLEVIIDEEQVISNTTSNVAAGSVSTVYLGKYIDKFDSKSYGIHWDDIALTTDSWLLYPYSVSSFVPAADGNYTAWTGTYVDVDEIPPDGVAFVYTSTATHKESFTCENCSSASLGKPIAGLKTNYLAKRDAYAVSCHFFMRDSGGTDRSTSSAQSLPVPWTNYAMLWELNPETSASWKAAEVNLSEIGMEHTAGAQADWDAGQIHLLYAGLAGRRVIASDLCCTV